MSLRTKQRKWRAYVEGADEIVKTLKSMGDAATAVLDRAAKEGAQVSLDDAKRRCPVDTGNLKSNIKMVKVKTNSATKRAYKVGIDKEGYYGTFVELGTKLHKAKPFLRPSIDDNESKIGKEVTKSISDEIGKRVL